MIFKNLIEVITYYKTYKSKGITFINGEKDELFISYENLYIRALHILYYLQERGLKSGDELVFQLYNNYDFISVFWACLLGKIIPVPITIGNNEENKLKLFNIWEILINPYLITDKNSFLKIENFVKNKNLHDELTHIKKKLILIENIHNGDKKGKILLPKESDTAFIQFSSGSTGDPKGIVLTHKNIITNINAMTKGIKPPKTGDISLSWLPLTHDMGLIGFHLGPMLNGWNQYLMPTDLFIRHPSLWLNKISEHKITLTSSPNFGYKHVLKYFNERKYENLDLSSIRIMVNGAEPISVELCYEFLYKLASFGLKRNVIFPVYGLAEATLAVTFSDPNEEIITLELERNRLNIGDKIQKPINSNHKISFVNVGSPIENCYVRIVDDNNEPVADEIIGHIQIKGDNITPGYYNNKKATSEAITVDGWLETGDLGFLRRNCLVITGRAKDILFVNGQNYYSHDLERIAEKIEGIELGKIIIAGCFNETIQSDEIVVFIFFRGKLENFYPLALECKKHFNQQLGIDINKIIPVNNIPKTTSGKLQRYKLVEKYKKGDFNNILIEIEKRIKKEEVNARIIDPQSEIEKKLAQIWRRITGRNLISIDNNFFELGATSIILTQLHAAIEQEYPNKVGITDFFTYPTIASLSKFIQSDLKTNNRINLIEYISLPLEFFKKDDKFSEDETRFILKIPPEINRKVLQISQLKEISDDDFYLTIFINLLHQISKNEKIRLQTIFKEKNTVTTHIFPLCELSDFSYLLKSIRNERLKNENTIKLNIKHISKFRFEMPKEKVSILFYNNKLIDHDFKLLSLYDIVIGYMEKNKVRQIILEYNGSRINRESIKNFILRYGNSIEMVVEQYI